MKIIWLEQDIITYKQESRIFALFVWKKLVCLL